jgi:hypothetical protein
MIDLRFEDSKNVPQGTSAAKAVVGMAFMARLNPCPSSNFVATLCNRGLAAETLWPPCAIVPRGQDFGLPCAVLPRGQDFLQPD